MKRYWGMVTITVLVLGFGVLPLMPELPLPFAFAFLALAFAAAIPTLLHVARIVGRGAEARRGPADVPAGIRSGRQPRRPEAPGTPGTVRARAPGGVSAALG